MRKKKTQSKNDWFEKMRALKRESNNRRLEH